MDVEISEGARGTTDLVPGPPVMFGQDLVQVPDEITANTPEKSRLRKQVSDLVDALQCEENKVHHNAITTAPQSHSEKHQSQAES